MTVLATVLFAVSMTVIAASVVTADDGVSFHCVGRCDSSVPPRSGGGNALMGGHMYPGVEKHSDLAGYRWFLERAMGGDVLVLTADEPPCDIYNSFLYNMSQTRQPNSVTTACFTSRSGTRSSQLQKLLNGASGIFVTGGDQYKYDTFWRDTPVASAISNGVVVGGSSAGLAIQGEFVFDAKYGSLESRDALEYPTDEDVSLVRDFIDVDTPWMHGVVTDTHFLQRDRMGRLVTFVARIANAGWARGNNHSGAVLGVGISEHTAVLVDRANGSAQIVGDGPVYFVSSGGRKPDVCQDGRALSWTTGGVDVWRWNASSGSSGKPDWNFGRWAHDSYSMGVEYTLTVHDGKLRSSLPGGGIY